MNWKPSKTFMRLSVLHIIAIILIASMCIMAVLAYVIVPDNSSDGNRMIVELSAKPPGFTKTCLRIPNPQSFQRSGLAFLLNGHHNVDQYIPYNDFHIEGDQVILSHYIDEGFTDTIMVPISKLPNLQSEAISAEDIVYAHTEHIQYLLGSDRFGRDILSRLILGGRVSLAVGFVAVFISMLIGITLGAIAGYFGKWVDQIVMYLINILWAIPTLLLVFAITLSLGKGFWQIFIAIGLSMWVSTARLVRGQVMGIKNLNYISASRLMGISHFRIITKNILPNIMGPILVFATSSFATAILLEAGLSFLGIGVQSPTPSWGLMIKEHYSFIITNQPFLAIIPGLAIFLMVFSIQILGNKLRDHFDIHSK